MVAEPVFIHGIVVDCVGEPPETDGESVGCGMTCSSDCSKRWKHGQLVSMRKIGTLPMISGDIDLRERTDSTPRSQWSLTIWSFFEKLNRTAAWMLPQVATSVGDPIITDRTAMMRAEKRFSAQAYCVLVLTCRAKRCRWSNKFPEVLGSRHGGSYTKSSSHIIQKSPKRYAKPTCRQRSQMSLRRRSVSRGTG